MKFANRHEAGRRLAGLLGKYAGRGDVLVLAVVRGGVPVGLGVAEALGAPLDVLPVRKLGVPGQPELAFGALARCGTGEVVRVLNRRVVEGFSLSEEAMEAITGRERAELELREREVRGGRKPLDPAGRVAIATDDGLATGSSMRAAVHALRGCGPARIVVAVPVGSEQTCWALMAEADEVVCVETPEGFEAVGQWYEDFRQVSGEEVRAMLQRARRGGWK